MKIHVFENRECYSEQWNTLSHGGEVVIEPGHSGGYMVWWPFDEVDKFRDVRTCIDFAKKQWPWATSLVREP